MFPLPSGTCRKVCRPVRNPPRLVNSRVVARMAVNAVKNGEDACAVSAAVAKAVNCSCEAEMGAVQDQAFSVARDLIEVQSALADLLFDLGKPTGQGGGGADKWEQSILRGLRRLGKWLFIVYDLAKVISSAESMSVSTGALLVKIIDLGICMRRVNHGKDN